MKVLLVGLHFSEYTYCLARELAKSNQVKLILNAENTKSELGDLKLEGGESLEINFLNHKKNISTFLRNTYKIVRHAKSFNPDIIHFQEVAHEYQTAALLFLRKWPFVLTVHDPKPHVGADASVRRGFGARKKVYSYVQRKLSSGLITHGEVLNRQLESTSKGLGPICDVHHGPLGLLTSGTKIRREPDEPFKFLFFGRMHRYKGIEIFVEAISSLRSEELNVCAVLAGKGPELSRLEGSLAGKPGYVIKNYYLSPKEVVDTFLEADVVVLPYTEGTQSGVLAYAIGLGKPCIITRVGSLPEMVLNEQTGFIIRPNSVSELVAAMKKMHDNRELCAFMAENAKRLGEDSLSWFQAAKKTSTFYKSIVYDEANGAPFHQ